MPSKRATSKPQRKSLVKGPVFIDGGRGGARFTVRLAEASGAPHLLVATACYGYGIGQVELFRVNQGNGFIVPRPAAISTGIVQNMREKGLISSGRAVGEWKKFLSGA